MIQLYHELIYRPLANALVLLYHTISWDDLGVAIVLLTLLVRLLLYPLFKKGIEHNLRMQELQPRLKKVRDDHKHNKEKEVAATLELFREHRTNPFSLMFFTFAQLPILIALYHLFSGGLRGDIAPLLYSWMPYPPELGATFLGLINLHEPHTIVVAIVALAQFAQAALAAPQTADEKTRRATYRNAGIVAVVIGVFLFMYHIPSAVGLYLITSAAFSIFQQRTVMKTPSPWKTGTTS
jgi:YidC/Oxa1 family membrane protein insertase